MVECLEILLVFFPDVLRDGEICQSGTHKELEKADGLYAHMWKEYNQSVCWKVGA